MEDRQILEQALDDDTNLDVALVSSYFSADLLAVAFGFAVEVLVTTAASDGGHVLHPEMIGICSDGVYCLFEADLNLIAQTIKLNDLQGIQLDVGAEEDEAPTSGVNDQDDANQFTQGSPEQVQAIVADGNGA